MFGNLVKFLILIATFLFFNKSEAAITIDCKIIKFVGKISSMMSFFYKLQKKDFKVRFLLGHEEGIEPIESGTRNWKSEFKRNFDVTKKTYIIIHGFLSHGKKDWIMELKDAILRTKEYNVLIVDWSDGCSTLDYPSAAKNTIRASYKTFDFLRNLKSVVSRTSDDIKWNQIYMAGASLGAHVAGQISALLRQEKRPFFHSKKITGMDPAGPCFKDGSEDERLDQEDADLVEVIHTEHLNNFFSLGSGESLGHVDFFMNAGIKQPGCDGLLDDIVGWIGKCSHFRASAYFIESFNTDCKFKGHAWNGGHKEAIKILEHYDTECDTCPVMGHKDLEDNAHGSYLVITGTQEKYCEFKRERDEKTIKKILDRLKTNQIKIKKWSPYPNGTINLN